MTRTMANRLFRQRMKFVSVRLVLVSTLLIQQIDSAAAVESDQDKNSTPSYVKRNDVNTNDSAPSQDKLLVKVDKTSEKSVFDKQILSDDNAASSAKTQHLAEVKSTTSKWFSQDAKNISAVDNLNLETSTPSSNVKERATPHMPPSPFEKVENLFTDFESQMIALHTELCGTSCGFTYSESKSLKSVNCSYCFCDPACLVYDDCCPDKHLLHSLPEITPGSKEMRATAEAKDLYTCEISHVRSNPGEADYNNYFSMINYCPEGNTSQVNDKDGDLSLEVVTGSSQTESSEAGGSWDGLKAKCENRGSQDHWDYHRPLTSPQGLVYRNKFCAQCQGEHMDNLTDWTTHVTCDAHLLRTASSASDAYFLALNTTECDVRFYQSTSEPRQHCSSVITPVISSCNQTGLWQEYDEKIERACASFTAVCLCRPVTCAAGFGLKGDNCTEVFASTNYFGFIMYSRLYITSEMPIEPIIPRIALMVLTNDMMTKNLLFANIKAYPALGCHDDRILTMDIVMDVHGGMAEPLRVIADSALGAFAALLYYLVGLQSMTNVTVVTPSPYRDASHYYPQSIPHACSTRSMSLLMGPLSGASNSHMDLSKMSFSPLENTTFCPRVNLTEAEFGNFTSRLRSLGLAESNVTFDVIYGSNMTFHLVCVEDYRVILSQDACLLTETSKVKTTDTFEDEWTPEGMTSLVCTCISLVSLLCVIVSYAALTPLREGTGLNTLAMVCLLFVAQALHELGLEQYENQQLCLVLAVLIHFFWLSAVFMMTACTLHIFYSVTFPLRARARLDPSRALGVSLLASFSLTAAIIGSTMLANQLAFGDLGYPARYLCFIRRSLSRKLGFGLPVGLAVLFNVVLFLVAIVGIRRRPQVSSTQQDRISLVACVRLSVVTGACWLTLFLTTIAATRPWLDYFTSALLGMQGLLLATTLLLNGRVAGLWRQLLLRWKKRRASRHLDSQQTCISGSGTTGFQQDNSTKISHM